MSAADDDAITRAQTVHERLARLRAHQTAERNRIYALVIQELLAEGYSLREAQGALGLSKTFIHKAAQRDTQCPEEAAEFTAVDEAVAQYVLEY
ncbi:MULTISPECIES: hypothetical protein [unclassified Microbacterium]|uniref:hypothetical protein n=1 Tax=unclassified Microbacterium TaxID=2609290 RepID=UPI000EA90075|nr:MULTISPECIES: hypothetical protein [unclassified Microbacterium]MBT2486940.1 hypothetical protein [Microbacterium sp. ISL-108]RKN64342.1 hypothetical protein D7252_19790 [Microbacterium sp. CGR2]